MSQVVRSSDSVILVLALLRAGLKNGTCRYLCRGVIADVRRVVGSES